MRSPFYRNAHIFLIGGAADQEPYYFVGPLRNISIAERKLKRKIQACLAHHEQIQLHTLGYNHIFHLRDIELNILLKIQPQDLIYIIGHSLGGWNAAHLSHQLTDRGYRVRLLATLDPVGEGKLVWLGSNIHKLPQSQPNADFWINIRAETQATYDLSDIVARLGQQWHLTNEPDLNQQLNIHHANVQRMLSTKLHTGKSILDYLIESLQQLL
ncbi:hydrolase [Actinobacillus vicugnae]|uniref:hydrolase n=1 Tax=Actinobacillus vicugnae TaxID=2573093 RepID=UPI0012423661|nr:hydrolase [Actinobacillus vicugnae]